MAEDLLSPPPASKEAYAAAGAARGVSRVQGTYKGTYQRFIVSAPDANNRDDRQYSHMYRRRLQALSGPVQQAAKEAWRGAGYRFADQAVQIKVGEAVALVGVVTKSMEKMPDILHELSLAEKGVSGDSGAGGGAAAGAGCGDGGGVNYVSEDDTVVLEDRSGRIALGGAVDPSLIVPGAVMAFRGTVEKGPVLNVDACCFPGFAPQRALPQLDLAGTTQEHVLFVSGLGFGSPAFDPLRTKLLLDFVCGSLGGGTDAKRSAAVSRVVVAGRSTVPGRPLEGDAARRPAQKKKQVEPLTELDHFLAHVASTAAVDLLPGSGEPTNELVPQQAFHRCLFPNAARFSSFKNVPNPHSFTQSGAEVVVSAGQPVADMRRYISAGVSDCDAMESTLRLRHVAPTAPDTLAAFPLFDKDPFVLDHTPHVYVTGNCQRYSSRVVQVGGGGRSLLVALPSFCSSGVAVLVNVRTLVAQPVCFGFD